MKDASEHGFILMMNSVRPFTDDNTVDVVEQCRALAYMPKGLKLCCRTTPRSIRSGDHNLSINDGRGYDAVAPWVKLQKPASPRRAKRARLRIVSNARFVLLAEFDR